MNGGGTIRTALALVALLTVGVVAGWAIRSGTEPSPASLPPPRETEPAKPRPSRRHVDPEPAPQPPAVELPPVAPAVAREVVGRVLLLPSHAPIAGAVVELWTGSPTGVSPCGRSATTGEDGVFRFAHCDAGYYHAEAHVVGLGSRDASGTVSAASGADLGDLTFGDGGIVEGRVLGPEGPISRASVFACRGGFGGMRTSVVSDTEGNYRFGDLRPGAYAIGLDLGGAGRRLGPSITVRAAATTRCDFGPAAHLSGRVTLDGVSVATGGVCVTRPDGQSVSARILDGSFRLANLDTGDATVDVIFEGRAAFRLPIQTLTLVAGENTLDVRAGEGERSGEIVGHATLPADRGSDQRFFIGFTLLAFTPQGAPTATPAGHAELDETDGFRMRGLRAGRYRLSLMRLVGGIGDDLGDFDTDLTAGERKTGVEVLPKTHDLESRAGRPRPEEPVVAEIRGRVSVEATGAPLAFPDVNLTLYNHSGDGKTPRVVGTGVASADGRFTIGATDVERLCLHVAPNVGSLREKLVYVDVAVGGRVENLEIALERKATGKVEFAVKDEQGRPVRMAYFVELVGGKPAPGGAWGGDSPTGAYRREYEAGTHVIRVGTTETEMAGQTTVEVHEGDTTKTDVVLHARK